MMSFIPIRGKPLARILSPPAAAARAEISITKLEIIKKMIENHWYLLYPKHWMVIAPEGVIVLPAYPWRGGGRL